MSGQERGWRLLVVDDEMIVGKRLRQVFSKMGYEVAVFTDPLAAVAAMEKEPFDIVVTDLKMEGLDGLGVLQKAKEVNPQARVIIITGYASAEVAEQAKQAGVFEFLVKPFRLDDLKEAIIRARTGESSPGRDDG